MARIAARGDIYHIDLDPIKGREQQGRRFVYVLSPAGHNKRGVVIALPSVRAKRELRVLVAPSVIDHHAPHHDRLQLPAQTQTPMESRPPFRLKPHWTRLSHSGKPFPKRVG